MPPRGPGWSARPSPARRGHILSARSAPGVGRARAEGGGRGSAEGPGRPHTARSGRAGSGERPPPRVPCVRPWRAPPPLRSDSAPFPAGAGAAPARPGSARAPAPGPSARADSPRGVPALRSTPAGTGLLAPRDTSGFPSPRRGHVTTAARGCGARAHARPSPRPGPASAAAADARPAGEGAEGACPGARPATPSA